MNMGYMSYWSEKVKPVRNDYQCLNLHRTKSQNDAQPPIVENKFVQMSNNVIPKDDMNLKNSTPICVLYRRQLWTWQIIGTELRKHSSVTRLLKPATYKIVLQVLFIINFRPQISTKQRNFGNNFTKYGTIWFDSNVK